LLRDALQDLGKQFRDHCFDSGNPVLNARQIENLGIEGALEAESRVADRVKVPTRSAKEMPVVNEHGLEGSLYMILHVNSLSYIKGAGEDVEHHSTKKRRPVLHPVNEHVG
jgi:hypothetical protein